MKTINLTCFFSNKQISRSILFCLFLLYSISGFSATVTWNGLASDRLWNTAGNWDSGTVPGAGDDVVIPVSSSVVVDLTPSAKVNKLQVYGSLIVNATATLTIEQVSNTSTVILEVLGGSITNNGTVVITQTLNNSNPGLKFSNGTGTDAVFTNSGTLTINTSAGTGDCVFFNLTTGGRTAKLNLGGTITCTPAATKNIMQCYNGAAQIDGTVVLGNVSDYQDYKLFHVAGGTLTLASTANLTVYTNRSTASNGAIHIASGSLVNNGSLTLHANPSNTTAVYGIYFNPNASATSTFTNNGSTTIDGSYPSGAIYMNTGTSTTAVLNNNTGASLSVSNSSSTSSTTNAAAIRANTGSTVIVNNAGTMTLSAVSKSMFFGGNLAVFNNNSGGVVNVAQAITGNSATLTSVINNYTGATFNFNVPSNSTSAISNGGLINFKNDGGMVTGIGIFSSGTFQSMTGTIAPGIGGDAGTGKLEIQGSAITLTGTLSMNVNGKTAGTGYDQILYSTASSTMDITGANLVAIVGEEYTPVVNDVIYFVSSSGSPAGTLTGPFSSADVPSGWVMAYTSHAKMTCTVITGLENNAELNSKIYAEGESIVVYLNESALGAQLELTDLTGRVVFKSILTEAYNKLTVGPLCGVYIARLTTASGTNSQKVAL